MLGTRTFDQTQVLVAIRWLVVTAARRQKAASSLKTRAREGAVVHASPTSSVTHPSIPYAIIIPAENLPEKPGSKHRGVIGLQCVSQHNGVSTMSWWEDHPRRPQRPDLPRPPGMCDYLRRRRAARSSRRQHTW